eukprot:Em0003g698a
MEESHENQILFSDSTTVADDDGGKTIDAVFLYLTESRYPSGSSDIFKRAIRRKAAMCVVRDGVLYVQKKKKNDHLHPIPVKAPWYHIGIDFIGPVNPTSSQWNRYILTISDYFSKFVEAVPLPTKNADGVSNVLFKIFMRMGIPKVLTSDNGSEFRNDLEMGLAKALGVKRIYTTPYHPQCNGTDKRFNQTLQNMLVKFIMDKKDVWDGFLDTCVYAYNTSVHESTSFSPFEVMFGRRGFMPVDIEIDKETPIINNEATSGADIERLSEQRLKTLTMAKMLIQKAQKKQRDVYDRKHSLPNSFSIGEFVLKKDFKTKKEGWKELETRYVGPYMIMTIPGKGF